jgi:hypothetical protein
MGQPSGWCSQAVGSFNSLIEPLGRFDAVLKNPEL